MFAVLLLSWWYSSDWSWLISRIASKYKFIGEALSVGILVKTFFSPWKQIQSTTTLQNFVQSTVDNLVSRVVGMFVRGIMLFTAIILYVVVTVFAVIALLVWPFLPLSLAALPVLAFGVEI